MMEEKRQHLVSGVNHQFLYAAATTAPLANHYADQGIIVIIITTKCVQLVLGHRIAVNQCLDRLTSFSFSSYVYLSHATFF